MERADSILIPPADAESLIAHFARSTKNALYSCFGCLQTSKEKAFIRYKQYEIEQQKKQFGVSYINLKKQRQDDQLPGCVETAMFRIAIIETEIDELKSTIASKNEEIKRRLVPAPGTPVSVASTPTSAATPATPPPETAVIPTFHPFHTPRITLPLEETTVSTPGDRSAPDTATVAHAETLVSSRTVDLPPSEEAK